MIGISAAASGSSEIIFQVDPLPIADPSMGVPVSRLEAGERRRMLVDLTEMLPSPLDPGSYDASISFGPEAIRAVSGPVHLVFRRPNDREAEILDRVGPELAARGSWGQWTRLPPLDPSNQSVPWGPHDPLRFNWILRDLLFGDEPLAAVPLNRLDVLDGLFESEREALRAELLSAGGDPVTLAGQVANVKRQFPALTRWMNQLLAGESEIAWARRVRPQ
jgi:hypothetical protein